MFILNANYFQQFEYFKLLINVNYEQLTLSFLRAVKKMEC